MNVNGKIIIEVPTIELVTDIPALKIDFVISTKIL